MPTTRPRHQVTETPDVAHALDVAARRWPGESCSQLLLRLVAAGGDAVEDAAEREVRRRRRAVRESAGAFSDAFDDGYLERLRQDWPEWSSSTRVC
jgi:hypothetical protein